MSQSRFGNSSRNTELSDRKNPSYKEDRSILNLDDSSVLYGREDDAIAFLTKLTEEIELDIGHSRKEIEDFVNRKNRKDDTPLLAAISNGAAITPCKTDNFAAANGRALFRG